MEGSRRRKSVKSSKGAGYERESVKISDGAVQNFGSTVIEESRRRKSVKSSKGAGYERESVKFSDGAGCEFKRDIIDKFDEYKVSKEEFISMIKLNCECDGSEFRLRIYDPLVRSFCADGMTYGAIRSKCDACKSILVFDGSYYKCFKMDCTSCDILISPFFVKRRSTWILPDNQSNALLKEWYEGKLKAQDYVCFEHVSALEVKEWDAKVVPNIDKYLKSWESYELVDDYCVFLTNRDVVERPRYAFLQLRLFKPGKWEGDNLYKLCLEMTDQEGEEPAIFRKIIMCTWAEALKAFACSFFDLTGFSWEAWLEEDLNHKKKKKKEDLNHDLTKLYPLKIACKSRLTWLETVRMTNVHEDLMVILDNLSLHEKPIKEKLIERAMEDGGITLPDIGRAFFCLNFNDYISAQHILEGKGPRVDKASKDVLEKELYDLSIVSRLVSLPMKTILLIDFDLDPSNEENLKYIWRSFPQISSGLRHCEHCANYERTGIFKISYVDFAVASVGLHIMELALSNEKVKGFLIYPKQRHLRGCRWSVLLRKAFSQHDSGNLILCTIDTEMDPFVGLKQHPVEEVVVEEQNNIEAIRLRNFKEEDCTKHGWIGYSAINSRMRMQLVFLVKKKKFVSSSVNTPPAEAEADTISWVNFVHDFNSMRHIDDGVMMRVADLVKRAGMLPYIYLGKDHEEKLKSKVSVTGNLGKVHEEKLESKLALGE